MADYLPIDAVPIKGRRPDDELDRPDHAQKPAWLRCHTLPVFLSHLGGASQPNPDCECTHLGYESEPFRATAGCVG
jgi:hypothetical protein